MSLVFAAITPHPPVLIPNIGQDNLKKIQATKEAMEKLEQDLYVSKPETILIISPHGHLLPDSFAINLNPTYSADLREFGDLITKTEYPCDFQLAQEITASAKLKNLPLVLQSNPTLDYGSAVPLFYLTRHLPKIKIIPLCYSLLPAKIHLDFGYLIKECVMKANRRVAIIASGDLSHALTSEAPGGFSPDGKKFDETIIEGLKNCNVASLLNLDPKFCHSAAECGLKSILILLGTIQHMNCNCKILSYEGPLGVGYLVAEFVLE